MAQINVAALKKVLKKSVKSGTVYWVKHEDKEVIGTEHLLIALSGWKFIKDPKLYAVLVEIGLIEHGCFRYGSETTAPSIDKLVQDISDSDRNIQAVDTKWTYEDTENKLSARILKAKDDNIYAAVNKDYFDIVTDVENWFIKDWKSPVFADNTALILPIKRPQYFENWKGVGES